MGHENESQNPSRVEIHGIPPGSSLVSITYWRGTSRRACIYRELQFLDQKGLFLFGAHFSGASIYRHSIIGNRRSLLFDSYLGRWELMLVPLIRRTTSPILEQRNVATLPLPSRKA
jgi:hypothetical protein